MGSGKRPGLDLLGAMGFGRAPDVIASVGCTCDEVSSLFVLLMMDACVTGGMITNPWSAKRSTLLRHKRKFRVPHNITSIMTLRCRLGSLKAPPW